jgi:hypothetical protein
VLFSVYTINETEMPSKFKFLFYLLLFFQHHFLREAKKIRSQVLSEAGGKKLRATTYFFLAE